MRRGTGLLLSVLTAGLVAGGCVERSLTIRTQPPGAMVYLNDRLMGSSPVRFDFVWYGWHRIILRKDGFERVEDHRLLRAPVYLWIPIDFVMELLPLPIRDRRAWDYTLTPVAAPPAPVAPALTPMTTPAVPPAAAPAAPAPATPTTTEETHDAR